MSGPNEAMALTLIIGNKNYSSWSLRPWIAMKVAGIPFDEKVIPLYEPGSREQVLKYSPAGKVPVLIDGDQAHLGIARDPRIFGREISRSRPSGRRMPRARGHARAVATEMHAGFQALRKNCPMNLWLPVKKRPQPDEVMDNVRRIDALWSDCRARFGQGGAVPVRRVWRGGRDVCAGRVAPA